MSRMSLSMRVISLLSVFGGRDRRRWSMLTTSLPGGQRARSSAAAAALKTAALSVASKLQKKSIEEANTTSVAALARAVVSAVSRPATGQHREQLRPEVAPQAATSSNPAGKYWARAGRYWVYASKFPQATLLVSAAPLRPKRSATADRNRALSANRAEAVEADHTWPLAASRFSPLCVVPISVTLLVSLGLFRPATMEDRPGP